MKDIIKKEHVYTHGIDKVWNAISIGSQITKWFIEADFQAKIGYSYTFTSPPEHGCTKIKGVVKKANPYELEYSWIVADTEVETIVNWVLEPTSEGTKLTLTHSGISNYPHETAIKMFESFSGGWVNCLNLLTNYLTEEVEVN